MIFYKTCPVCGNEFVTQIANKRYCSGCRSIVNRQNQRKYWERHGGEVKRQRAEIRNRKKREIDWQLQDIEKALLPEPVKPLEQVTIKVHGQDMLVYQCAKLDMRATTLPCGLRQDCYRLKCPHIPKGRTWAGI